MKLISALDFPEEELEHAALQQPSLYERASRMYVRAMRTTLQIKAELQEKEARVSLAYRKQFQEAAVQGKTRPPSEAQIQSRVRATKLINDFYVKLHQAESEEEYLRLLLDAYKMRRDAIRVLADLRRADMGEAVVKAAKEASASEAAQEVVKGLKKRWPGEL